MTDGSFCTYSTTFSLFFLILLITYFSIIHHPTSSHFFISLVIHFDLKQCYIHLPQEFPCSCFLNFKGIIEVQCCFLLTLDIHHINHVKSLFHYVCLFTLCITRMDNESAQSLHTKTTHIK